MVMTINKSIQGMVRGIKMTKKGRIIIFLMYSLPLICVPCLSLASNWVEAYKDKTSLHEVDLESVRTVRDASSTESVTSGWVRIFGTDKKGKFDKGYIQMLLYVKCESHAFAAMQGGRYNQLGESIGTEIRQYPIYENAAPDSVSETLVRIICAQQ